MTANGENAQIAVSWTVPANGGASISEAQATAFSSLTGGTQDGTCTSTTNLAPGDTTTCTITGLTNGTTYYVSIQSENSRLERPFGATGAGHAVDQPRARLQRDRGRRRRAGSRVLDPG